MASLLSWLGYATSFRTYLGELSTFLDQPEIQKTTLSSDAHSNLEGCKPSQKEKRMVASAQGNP